MNFLLNLFNATAGIALMLGLFTHSPLWFGLALIQSLNVLALIGDNICDAVRSAGILPAVSQASSLPPKNLQT